MKRSAKIALWGGIAALLLALPFAPKILSVPPGKSIALYLLGKRAGAHLEVERLSLSWLGPQRGEGISFQSNAVEGKIDEVLLKQPLAPSFRRSLELNGGRLTFPEGGGNVEALHLSLEEGKFAGSAQLSLSSLQGEVSLSGESNLAFSLPHLWIDKGRCDLHKVLFREGQNLETLFTLLKAPSRGGGQMEIWFAPFSFTVKRGKVEIERVDFLINRRIHLCLWGTFYLEGEKLDFTIGLPSDTLAQTLGISISERSVLPLYLTGTLQAPVLDAKEAKAQIAALLVTSTVGSQVGSQIGKKQPLFGQLFETATRAAGGKAGIEAPPPSRPFPWE